MIRGRKVFNNKPFLFLFLSFILVSIFDIISSYDSVDIETNPIVLSFSGASIGVIVLVMICIKFILFFLIWLCYKYLRFNSFTYLAFLMCVSTMMVINLFVVINNFIIIKSGFGVFGDFSLILFVVSLIPITSVMLSWVVYVLSYYEVDMS